MKNKNSIVIPAIALMLICLVATLLLAMTDKMTRGKIAEADQAAADKARSAVLSEASEYRLNEEITDAEVYEGYDASGNMVGYTATVSGKSYGGDLKIMVGFDTEGTILGVEILTINDTPSLGMNAKKESFRNQYVGKTGELTVSKNASGDEIQALTGATISSKAVTDCVNKAYKAIFGEGGSN